MIETNITNLEINELTEEQYKSAKESGTLNSDAFYMTPSSESVITPISQGGTNARTAQEARTNLGFEYGTENPTHIPTTGDGAIYFKIDNEEASVTPIEEGGTGAVTGHEALVNLGAIDYIVEQGTSDIWTYRKWNSGVAECWISTPISVIGSTASGALSGGYYAQLNSPPFGYLPIKFVTYPSITCSGRLGTGLGILNAALSINASGTTVADVFCWGNQSSTSINDISIEIKGRWK